MEEPGKEIPIIRTNPTNLKPEYMNDFIVGHTANEFFLTCSMIEPPQTFSEQELKELSSIEAIAIAKFVVTPEYAVRIRNALTTNIDKYEAKFGHIAIKTLNS